MKEKQKIFCDEAGNTGGDLIEDSQPYFVYSGVQLDFGTAEKIRKFIYKNYNVQGGEIKGKNLVKSIKGQEIIYNVFRDYSTHARIVFHDKKYALAAKIVEYGIEPYLTSNTGFYETNFNTFLATSLYSSFLVKAISAEELYKDFSLLLNGKILMQESRLSSLGRTSNVIRWFLDIIMHNPQIIVDEISDAEGDVQKWILDLTQTSLMGILTDWSKNGESLEVICDNAPVFNDPYNLEYFNSMGIEGLRGDFLDASLGFNLKQPILLKDSKSEIGLQIADVFSSATYYCLKNRSSDFSKKILSLVLKNSVCKPHSFCVMPDSDFITNGHQSKKIQELMASTYFETTGKMWE